MMNIDKAPRDAQGKVRIVIIEKHFDNNGKMIGKIVTTGKMLPDEFKKSSLSKHWGKFYPEGEQTFDGKTIHHVEIKYKVAPPGAH